MQLPEKTSNTLAPNRLGPHSRQTSSNTSEGNNRESSLDDSGVVDDHEEGDATSEDVSHGAAVVRVKAKAGGVLIKISLIYSGWK